MNNIRLISGAEVSNVTLGTGGAISADELMRLLDLYYELGGRTVDTARMYDQLGEKSELVIGRWIKSRGVRDSITIVTKGGYPRERMIERDLTEDIERSLDALCTVPDLYLLHRDNPEVPAGEFADIADSFVSNGYTRLWGVSNWDSERIVAVCDYASLNSKSIPALSQIQWSLAETSGEKAGDSTLVCMNESQRSFYRAKRMPIMAFASQAKGFFSKYASGAPFSDKVNARFVSETNLKRAENVKNLSRELGVSAAAIALGYIISSGLNSACVVGCRNEAQLRDSMTAADIRLTAEQLKFLEG